MALLKTSGLYTQSISNVVDAKTSTEHSRRQSCWLGSCNFHPIQNRRLRVQSNQNPSFFRTRENMAEVNQLQELRDNVICYAYVAPEMLRSVLLVRDVRAYVVDAIVKGIRAHGWLYVSDIVGQIGLITKTILC